MIFLSKLMLKWINWFIHYLHYYTYYLSPELFIFKGQFAIFRLLFLFAQKEIISKRNQPNRQLEKIKKYFFVLQLLQIKVFGKSKFWGKSSKISKDYLGRGDTVSIFEKQVGSVTTRIWNYRKYLGGGREGGLKTRNTACHPPKKNSECAPETDTPSNPNTRLAWTKGSC